MGARTLGTLQCHDYSKYIWDLVVSIIDAPRTYEELEKIFRKQLRTLEVTDQQPGTQDALTMVGRELGFL